jgi:hypothetical protein
MAFKVPSDIIKASKALSVSILKDAGGSSAVANSLDRDRQYIHNCTSRGYVPVKSVYDISRLLGVSAWTLCYHKLMEAFGEEAPSFKEVIKEAPLLPKEKTRILNMLR